MCVARVRVSSIAKRKWRPAQIRAIKASSAAAVKLAQPRVVVQRRLGEAFNRRGIAKIRDQNSRRATADALMTRIVVRVGRRGGRGIHAGSCTVSGLPSLSASRIAVIGRQSSNQYFASQQDMIASACAMFSTANSRAFCESVRCRAREAVTAARFQNELAVPPQNRAASVWSAVRVTLAAAPTDCTSLRLSAYA